MNSEKTWYLVATKPNEESLAALNLKNQGFCVFWPKMHKTIRHARQASVRVASLFPGYLFVERSPRADWRSVSGTFGAKKMVINGDGPVAVASGFVEALQARVGSNDVIDFMVEDQPEVPTGSAGAAFTKKISGLANLNDQGRIFMLMEFVGPRIPVPASAIKAGQKAS